MDMLGRVLLVLLLQIVRKSKSFSQICTCMTTKTAAQLQQPAELIATGQQRVHSLGRIDVSIWSHGISLSLLQISTLLLTLPESCCHQLRF